jgi:hypothetical protein
MKNSTNNRFWQGCGGKGTLIYFWWEFKLVKQLWKKIWRLLKNLNIDLPYDPAVVPRSQDPKRPLRRPKSHAKTKSLYSGLSSGSLTSLTQRICTDCPEPHPSRVFIGEGQEAGLPILGVNRLDIIQVRRSWHIGIGFYSNCVLAMRNVAKVIPYLVTLSKGLLCSIMIGPGLRWCIPEESSYPGYGAFQG